MDDENGRNIPAGIKRQVRQECFFGCVFCGMPVFEYEHIDDWADVKKHEAHNIVLLCPTHHAAKTTKKLSRERVRAQRREPFNKTRKKSASYKLEGDSQLQVQIAHQHFFGDVAPTGEPCDILSVNGRSMASVRLVDGWLTLSLSVTDHSGNPVLEVVDGEVTVSTSVWDYTYEGSKITVRSASREILLEIRLNSSFLVIARGAFLTDDQDGFVVEGEQIKFLLDGKDGLTLAGVGGRIGSGRGALAIVNRRRYPDLDIGPGWAVICDPVPSA